MAALYIHVKHNDKTTKYNIMLHWLQSQLVLVIYLSIHHTSIIIGWWVESSILDLCIHQMIIIIGWWLGFSILDWINLCIHKMSLYNVEQTAVSRKPKLVSLLGQSDF